MRSAHMCKPATSLMALFVLLALMLPSAHAQLNMEVAALTARVDSLERELQSSIDALQSEIDTIESDEAHALEKRLGKIEKALDRQIPWGWYLFGLAAQVGFFCRFLVQWLASEKAGESVVPVAFWYLSIAGSMMLLAYATFFLLDPIIILGQSTGLLIYLRNLALVARKKRKAD